LWHFIHLCMIQHCKITPKQVHTDLSFKVCLSVIIQSMVFWVLTSYNIFGGYQRFGRIFCVCLQG
jgi:hypothetical protein